MTNWFNGATNLHTLRSSEEDYVDEDGNFVVEGTNVFGGCDLLLGGNGTQYVKTKVTGVDYLKEDYIIHTEDPSPADTVHAGYLTPAYNGSWISYDYNGGEGATIINAHSVQYDHYLTVGGENQSFASVPTKGPFTFEGWEYDGQVYQQGDHIDASFGTETTQSITLTAKWSQEQPPVSKVPVIADNYYYDAQPHNVIKEAGIPENPESTIYYNVTANSLQTPVEGWSTDFTSFKATEPAAYYVWYKVDDGPAALVLDEEGEVGALSVLTCYAMYYDKYPIGGGIVFENVLITAYYDPVEQGPIPPEYEKDIVGFIPVGVEYTSADQVPWYSKMKDIKTAFLSPAMME